MIFHPNFFLQLLFILIAAIELLPQLTLAKCTHKLCRVPYNIEPYCTIEQARPVLVCQRYTLESCISVKFGAYLSLGKPSFAQETYIELKNGIVNRSLSRCAGIEGSHVEPKVVIDFDCGSLTLSIVEEVDPLGSQVRRRVLQFDGEFNIGQEQLGFTKDILKFKQPQSCLFHESRLIQAFSIGLSEELVIDNFAYKISYKTKSSSNENGDDNCPQIQECSASTSQGKALLIAILLFVCLSISAFAIIYVWRRKRQFLSTSSSMLSIWS